VTSPVKVSEIGSDLDFDGGDEFIRPDLNSSVWQPGMHAFRTSGSLRPAHTTSRGAVMRSSPVKSIRNPPIFDLATHIAAGKRFAKVKRDAICTGSIEFSTRNTTLRQKERRPGQKSGTGPSGGRRSDGRSSSRPLKPVNKPAPQREAAREPAGVSAAAERPLIARTGERPPERVPVILESLGAGDFHLIDSGNGEKLEQYGPYRIIRPKDRRCGSRRCPGMSGKRSMRPSPAIPTKRAPDAGVFRRSARRDLAAQSARRRFPRAFHLLPPCRRVSRADRSLDVDEAAGRAAGPAAEGAEPVRLYRRCLAGGGGCRRRSHACRCVEEGDRLGARKPGAEPARQGADPLDLRRRDEVHPARGTPRQYLRHHPHRPAEIRSRAEWRGLASVRAPAADARYLPRDPVAEGGRPGADGLFDPGQLLFDPRVDARDDARRRRRGRVGRTGDPRSRARRQDAGRALSTSLFSRWVPK
jgi:hypothetical protein